MILLMMSMDSKHNYGILTSLEKFDTHFGLKLAYLLFGASEEVSKSLQAKNATLQEGLASVKLASAFYKRQRTEEAFGIFFNDVVRRPASSLSHVYDSKRLHWSGG